MAHEYYLALHIAGVIWLFTSLGAAAVRGFTGDSQPALKRFVTINHGIAMLVILVAGMGLWGTLGMIMQGWVFVKIAIWIALGAMVALLKRNPKKMSLFWTITLLLGFIAIYMAVFKPF